MTAVIALLNKHGVAIAADSAVTRNRNDDHKVTKNGNKMLRLSNVVPVSVMTTGNANFIGNPWDVVIRHYRKEHGDIKHATVEECMKDFFEYISKNKLFWNDKFISVLVEQTFDKILKAWDIFNRFGAFNIDTSIKILKKEREKIGEYPKSPQFEKYTYDQFREFTRPIIDNIFTKNNLPKENDSFRNELVLSFFERLTRCRETQDSAFLVFSGFGSDEELPSLVSVCVCEGFDHHINYFVKDNISINNQRPIAFCPFAQDDVMKGLIQGMHTTLLDKIEDNTISSYKMIYTEMFKEKCKEADREFLSMINQIKRDDLKNQFIKAINCQLGCNQEQWENALEHYDLKAMAALAESLIDLTGFHRILTFKEEGVGGPVDVAVISKNDGFIWLSRKSWYHHKDVNGIYGSLGI